VRIVLAGSGGLIGTELRRSYERAGHTVVRLVRREPQTPGEVRWDLTRPDAHLVEGADAVVNLAGAGIGSRRWSREYEGVILRSRIETARALAVMAAEAARPPTVVLSASGIRYYGIDRGDEVLTEASRPGSGRVLPTVAQAWEAATQPASDAGIRVCHLRLGLVLSRRGGLFPLLLRMFRSGVGAYFASGQEFWSYVSLADTVQAIRFLAGHSVAAGPYNISAPNPVRNKELMQALARLTGARAVLPVPLAALRIVLGRIATEVFGGLRVMPARLAAAGFAFHHPDADSALRAALTG
jgi:uncharacterized protein (TIGR01777 family)